MLAENNKIFDTKHIFSVLNILLFDLHEDIDLVEG
jgi:hypothetical protein